MGAGVGAASTGAGGGGRTRMDRAVSRGWSWAGVGVAASGGNGWDVRPLARGGTVSADDPIQFWSTTTTTTNTTSAPAMTSNRRSLFDSEGEVACSIMPGLKMRLQCGHRVATLKAFFPHDGHSM